MYYYTCFGFIITSDVELPILETTTNTVSDIQILVRKDVDVSAFSSAKNVNGFLVENENRVGIKTEFGWVIIENGTTIILKLNYSDPLQIQQYVLSSGLGIILHQKRILVLHGSAVEKEGEAIIFIGESGNGKSSTAYNFVKNGYSLLSDDLSVIRFEKGTPYVYSGYSRQKIAQDILEKYNDVDFKNEKPIQESRLKYFRNVKNFDSKKVKVKAVYHLSKKDIEETCLFEQEAMKRFHKLYRNTFRFKLIAALNYSKIHMELCTQLYKQVHVGSILLSNKNINLDKPYRLIISKD